MSLFVLDTDTLVLFQEGHEWAEKLRACIDLHPVVTRFVDDSRESIYAGRGE